MAAKGEAMLHLHGALFAGPVEIVGFRGARSDAPIAVEIHTATSTVEGRLIGVGRTSPVSLLVPYAGEWSRIVAFDPAPVLRPGMT